VKLEPAIVLGIGIAIGALIVRYGISLLGGSDA